MRKAHIALSVLLFLFCSITNVHAQAEEDTASAFPFVRFQYTFVIPSGDIEDTYGNAHSVGGAIGYKTASNWQFEFEGGFMFGSDIKRKDLLSDIINANGDVTDLDGELVKIILDMRGINFYASAGKIIPVLGSNKNSGLLLQAGIGYMQHKIRVDYRDGEVFQLSEEMLKGYDRLHTGVALRQFVGFQYYGKSNLTNFYLGIELNQGLTKNRRGYNYDTRSFDTDRKTDILSGLRFGWTIPIKQRTDSDFYYY